MGRNPVSRRMTCTVDPPRSIGSWHAARLRGRPGPIVALLLALGVVGCSGAGDVGADPTTVVVCLPVQPAGLNPFTSPDLASADFNALLFTPLVRYDADDRIQPLLARDWSWNDARTELTIRLRDDIRWHDGQQLTAADVAWSIRIAADTAYAYWSAEDFFSVEEVSALDAGTVRVRFTESYGPGMEPFAGLTIMPEHLLGDVPAATFAQAPYHREPIGSGPFRFAGRNDRGDIVLERDPGWPAELGMAQIDRLVLRTIPEVSAQLVELRTGNVHACVLPPAAADEAGRTAMLSVVAIPPASVQVLPLRNDRVPFDDVRVRRAVSAALNRAELAQVISAAARPAANFLPRNHPARADSLNQTDNDLTRARALLDSAGWRAETPDAIRTRNGEPLTFTIHASQSYRDMLTAAQAQLRRVGIDAQLQLLESSTYIGMLQDPAQRPTAMAIAFTPTKTQNFDPYAELHSTGYSNLSSYESAFVDSLVSILHSTQDTIVRRRTYVDLQRAVADDVPAVYTVYVPRILAYRQELHGVRVSSGGPFSFVTEWRLEEG